MVIEAINDSLGYRTTDTLHHVFDDADLQKLHHFQTITVCTLATSSISRVYQAEIVKLACSHPYLLHAVLTIAEMHCRYASSDRASPAELYHWQKTTSLFNQKLAHPIKPEDADAVFATSTLLNGISMASIETDQYLDAWPLKSNSYDLQWLRMQGGIKLMVLAAQPWRKGSIFESLSFESDDDLSTFTDTRPGIAGIPAPFVNLCDLSVLSTVENNPYHAQVRMLCPLLSMECTRETLMEHLNFIAEMRPEFLELLQQRDARALLILGYWYGLVCRCSEIWWLTRRASVECTAICSFLDTSEDSRIRELLEVPARACGYRRIQPAARFDTHSLLAPDICRMM